MTATNPVDEPMEQAKQLALKDYKVKSKAIAILKGFHV